MMAERYFLGQISQIRVAYGTIDVVGFVDVTGG
jgi:hypothetical protein